MLIALANLDGSFTCTLFMPFKGENSFDLQTRASVEAFLKKLTRYY
jgi:kynurenine 3-monooxygenase